MADPMAGSIMSAGLIPGILLPVLSSALIYAGGCSMNDLADRKLDATERPERPIPSGRIKKEEAANISVILLTGGLILASFSGGLTFLIALLLTVSVISYNFFLKKIPFWGPLSMGLNRALNLLLGMSLAFIELKASFLFPAITLVFVFTITTLSRHEAEGTIKNRGAVLLGWLIVMAGMIFFLRFETLSADAMVFLVPLCVITGAVVLKAVSGAMAPMSAVGMLVLTIPILDAVYAAGTAGIAAGVVVAALFIPSFMFSKMFQVS